MLLYTALILFFDLLSLLKSSWNFLLHHVSKSKLKLRLLLMNLWPSLFNLLILQLHLFFFGLLQTTISFCTFIYYNLQSLLRCISLISQFLHALILVLLQRKILMFLFLIQRICKLFMFLVLKFIHPFFFLKSRYLTSNLVLLFFFLCYTDLLFFYLLLFVSLQI